MNLCFDILLRSLQKRNKQRKKVVVSRNDMTNDLSL